MPPHLSVWSRVSSFWTIASHQRAATPSAGFEPAFPRREVSFKETGRTKSSTEWRSSRMGFEPFTHSASKAHLPWPTAPPTATIRIGGIEPPYQPSQGWRMTITLYTCHSPSWSRTNNLRVQSAMSISGGPWDCNMLLCLLLLKSFGLEYRIRFD
jgi:hypothetical protein